MLGPQTRDDDPLKTVKEPRGRRMRGKEFWRGGCKGPISLWFACPGVFANPRPGSAMAPTLVFEALACVCTARVGG